MRKARTILIVDGDPAVRQTLREQLSRDGQYRVVEAATAAQAELLLAGAESGCAAVIMDVALPDGDGHAVCARLRTVGQLMPVILMNGQDQRGREPDVIVIAKPFRLSELMTRLRTLLDVPVGVSEAPTAIRIGPYEFSAQDKALRHRSANQRIRLTEKEAAILAFLHRMGARAVARQELLTEVWGYNPAVTTHTLETHIYRLRRKIEVDPANACLLITEAGGYRLAVG
jgi:DNA-binding response OmpR family regulator